MITSNQNDLQKIFMKDLENVFYRINACPWGPVGRALNSRPEVPGSSLAWAAFENFYR